MAAISPISVLDRLLCNSSFPILAADPGKEKATRDFPGEGLTSVASAATAATGVFLLWSHCGRARPKGSYSRPAGPNRSGWEELRRKSEKSDFDETTTMKEEDEARRLDFTCFSGSTAPVAATLISSTFSLEDQKQSAKLSVADLYNLSKVLLKGDIVYHQE